MSASESCWHALPPKAVERVAYRRLLAGAGKLYCRLLHRTISRPVNGRYRCWRCLREFEAGW